MKDVSIIIPSYVTTEESYSWLLECVRSALKQDCHVVLYDDCSNLSIPRLLEDLGNPENLVASRGDKHRGVSAARNRAVEQCSTSLILPLDCDDILADNAIEKMMEEWKGVPIYPDIAKFGLQEISHYRLLDFSCDLMTQKLGISSVNVLHAVDQWKSIGGWNETINLYEDAEYNARLMLTFCGQNLHQPLVRYRQHASQKTRTIKDTSASVEISRDILNSLRRFTVSCPACGGKRRSSVQAMPAIPTSAVPASLPGEQDGRILATYIGGKGQGAHYYKGISTHFAYKVKFGEYYYVDPSDATSSETPNRRSLFVKVERKSTVEQIATKKLEEITRTPITAVEKVPMSYEIKEETPVVVEEAPVVVEGLPDISTMSVGAVMNLDLSGVDVKTLLQREESGKNRSGLKNYLSKLLGG